MFEESVRVVKEEGRESDSKAACDKRISNWISAENMKEAILEFWQRRQSLLIYVIVNSVTVTLYMLSHLILTAILTEVVLSLPHFTNKETKEQGEGT